MFAVISALALAESFLFIFGWQGHLVWYEMIFAHVAIVSTAALAILRLADNLAVAATTFMATLTTGPFGAMAVAVMLPGLNRNTDHNFRDSNWLHRIRIPGVVEREEALYHDIVAGRAYLPGEAPAVISATMRKASPADRIEVLSSSLQRIRSGSSADSGRQHQRRESCRALGGRGNSLAPTWGRWRQA